MHPVPSTGRLIAGRYRLHNPIGRGAMGTVWRGHDELLARDVAVKEVQVAAHADEPDAEGAYQRTLREARTAARLSHPNVVRVFDIVTEDGVPWIVMELVHARSLDRIIAEDGPLPPERAAELGASLVSALAAAHSAGVLHRDVKPSNVLVTSDGRAVLTDFGIAVFAADPSRTVVGLVSGTPGFTPPERVRGGPATPAADLWSLGATLYTAVEGHGPFDREGGSSVITAGVATEDPPPARSAGPLGPAIDALLSRDPAARPDAAAAARMLTAAATAAGWDAASGQPAPGPDAISTVAQPQAGPGEQSTALRAGSSEKGTGGSPAAVAGSSRRSRLAVAAGVTVLTVAALVGWALAGTSPSTHRAAGAGPAGAARSPAASAVAARVGTSGPKRPDHAGTPSAAPGVVSHPKATGKPGASTSVKPSTGASPVPRPRPSASVSPAPGNSPGPDPGPIPSPAGQVLPAGYRWHLFTAAELGAVAGFKIAVPDAWTQAVSVPVVHLNAPVRRFHIVVDLSQWAYPKPLAQAQYLQAEAAASHNGYRLLALAAIAFKSVGYRAAVAAELKFSWLKASGARITELVVLVTLPTKSGDQPFALSVWAPTAVFPAARAVFDTALETFRPLPAS